MAINNNETEGYDFTNDNEKGKSYNSSGNQNVVVIIKSLTIKHYEKNYKAKRIVPDKFELF